MSIITRRPYRGETDLDAIANLINTCESVDQLEEGTSVTELKQSFDDPFIDKERDLFLWQDADDQLIGFSRLWIVPTDTVIDGFLGFRVHPTARSGDLQEQIIAWAEERLRQVSQERGLSVNVRCGSRADQTDRITILERCGFKRDRYFFTMALGVDAKNLSGALRLYESVGFSTVKTHISLVKESSAVG
ncbi:MAG: hypothetical protein RIB93_31755 [Coleofasciculus sp. D1-CHI-01]|uniref:hypothetical protein n=1 Tax=Coleofasciculus sp. D1-CHI-01 TaxID=3068482 RepID=UPI0032F267E1